MSQCLCNHRGIPCKSYGIHNNKAMRILLMIILQESNHRPFNHRSCGEFCFQCGNHLCFYQCVASGRMDSAMDPRTRVWGSIPFRACHMSKSLGKLWNPHNICPLSSNGYQVELKLVLFERLQQKNMELHSPQTNETVKKWIPIQGINWCQNPLNLRGYLDYKHTPLHLLFHVYCMRKKWKGIMVF